MSYTMPPILNGRLTTFHYNKDGKLERIESSEHTDEEAKVHLDRITDQNNEVVQKMNAISKSGLPTQKPNAANRDGKLVILKPLPVFCYGKFPNNDYGANMYRTVYDKLEKVFTGEADMDSIETAFRDTVSDMQTYLYNQGFGDGSAKETEQLIGDTYQLFRLELLNAAVRTCNNEGRELYDTDTHPSNVKYYNADYYYKSEDAKTLLAELSQTLGKEHGLASVDLTSKGGYWAGADDFNTAWSTPTTASIFDTSTPPPRGLKVFIDLSTKHGYGEVQYGGETKRFSTLLGGYGASSCVATVGDRVGADFAGGNKEVYNYLKNLYFFNSVGGQYLKDNDLFPRRGINNKA